ncbi:outer membrane beta-barrel protein [Xanthomarina gelatinilytica]|jgi:hypothetical protein|uniref:PorT family protein n=1 Tax=Xanthomarina gelatinilytica TaxID=1137281 RepID=M7MLG3_9FLAO|nr:outer membrane beta-barrel protein [Xanthomarina gelatinilytica]EMQ95730.1 hypothetical protein D778_01620 [Xanthomarina gelatinilytica]HCY80099.1 PorT family protein [Xanthomarina gelatinilytica]
MKKQFILFVFIFTCSLSQAQDLSYGVVFGGNYLHPQVKNSSGSISSQNPDRPNIHLGGFISYQFSEKLGVKLNTQYNRIYQNYLYTYSSYTTSNNINALEIIPQVKLNFHPKFYFLSGPRFSFVISVDRDGEDIKDFYKSYLIGAQLGFGFNPSKYFAIEFIGDYGFSDISEAEPIEIKTFGGYLNFAINLESIINK